MPQRAAAWAMVCRFAEQHGADLSAITEEPGEERPGYKVVGFVGCDAAGRQFSIGYEWTPRQAVIAERGRWPSDVKVPPRQLTRRSIQA